MNFHNFEKRYCYHLLPVKEPLFVIFSICWWIYILFFFVLVHFQFVFHLKESKEYHNYLIHLLTIIQQQILNKLFVFSIFYFCLSKYILNLIAMIIRMVRTMYACLYVILTVIYKTATNVDDQTTKKAFTLKLYVF